MSNSTQWSNIEFYPANGSEYDENIHTFLNISDEKKSVNETYLLRNVMQHYDFEPAILIVSLCPLSISIVLQALAIKYERTEMDPMKRGFTNQV